MKALKNLRWQGTTINELHGAREDLKARRRRALDALEASDYDPVQELEDCERQARSLRDWSEYFGLSPGKEVH